MSGDDENRKPSAVRRLAPALFLMFFAPVSAEYLIGYDDTIGNAAALIFGLFVFAPLYGAPAVLIREVARRTGRGWPTMLLLGLAFGLLQAGTLDQSLFNTGYRAIPYWNHLRLPTLLPGSWTSAAQLVGFLGGHMIGSICAPIALTESLFPRRSHEPWLGRVGLVTMSVLWVAGAIFVLNDTLHTETFRASTAQLAVTALVTVGLVVLAMTRPRVDARAASSDPAPSPVVVFAVSVLILGVHQRIDSRWLPVIVDLAMLAVLGVLVTRWSARAGWGERHVLAAAAGALIAVSVAAFWVDPLGHVPAGAKYATNSVLLVLVLLLVRRAISRQRAAGGGGKRPAAG